MAVGVLMLPVALVVMSFGPWLETRVWAESAAAETARAATVTLDQQAGESVFMQLAADRNLTPDAYRIGWCSAQPATQGSADGSCYLGRGASIVVRIEVWTPLISTPWGSVGGLWVRASHAEPVDLYRSLG